MASQMPEPDNNTYIFGPFRFSPARQLLLRDGVPVRVGARALDILTLLVRQPGVPVSKSDLNEFVWPDTFVHESNLKVNVAALRRALSGPTAENSYIVSVPRRGYRFVGSVEVMTGIQSASTWQPLEFRRSFPDLPNVIGRAGEISVLKEILEHARCVTVVGPGGVGKTTVAIAVAHQVGQNYKDGVCFIDLATVGDPQFATTAIADAVGARRSDSDPVSGIIGMLHGRKVLLVVDNCEHLTETVASAINRLLSGLPGVTILATSREPLGIVSEHVYRLPTLEVPPVADRITAERALAYPAIELFVARANERDRYVLSEGDAPLVVAICQHLDGIALAIELAASKTGAFGVPKLLTMLEQRFHLLSSGPRDAPIRQQTLQATLDWSYRLLSDDEAKLLRFLSVYAGPFHLTDAVALSGATGLDAPQTIHALERLTTRSLVAWEYSRGAQRYRLLESTRAYAAERLLAEAEEERAMSVYARHILTTFERADSEWRHRDKQEWITEYASRIDDLRKVLSWAFGASGDWKLGVLLTAVAIPLWEEMSLVSEFRASVDIALAAIPQIGDCPIDVRMRLAWSRASGMNFAHPLVPETESAWLACYELGDEGQSTEYQLRGLWGLSICLIYTGRSHEAIVRLDQFRSIAERGADWSAVPEGERVLSMAEIYTGELNAAKERLEKLLDVYRSNQVPVRNTRYNLDQIIAIKCSLALVYWLSGEPVRAAQVVREAVERSESIGHFISQSNLLALGALPIAIWSGSIREAERYQALLEEGIRREYIEIWARMTRFFGAVLRSKRGQPDGLPEMKARLQELVDWRFVMRAPFYYCMLAEMLLAREELDEAAAAMDEARAYAMSPGERWCLAEVLRVDGLLQLHSGRSAEAETLLKQAIHEAQQIGAGTLEARAAVSLAHQLERERRSGEALDIVEEVYGKLTETSGFADLARARNRLRKHLRAPVH